MDFGSLTILFVAALIVKYILRLQLQIELTSDDVKILLELLYFDKMK